MIIAFGLSLIAGMLFGYWGIIKGLDVLQKIAGISAMLFGSFAVWQYFQKQKNDTLLATLDQVSFFRKEIIRSDEDYMDFVKQNEGFKDYTPVRIPLKHSFSLEDLIRVYPKEVKMHIKLFLLGNGQLKQLEILNLLEDFSLRVIHLGTMEHVALKCIMPRFVNMVEENTFILLFIREYSRDDHLFGATIKLYSFWESLIFKVSPEERDKKMSSIIDRLNEKW